MTMFDEVKRLHKKRTMKLALFSGVAIGIVFIVMCATVKSPKQTRLCTGCHTTVSFHNSCKKSSSKDIACGECHHHENKGTIVAGVKIKGAMGIEINDELCTTEACHSMGKLSAKPVQYKKITPFEHKTHTGVFSKDFTLRCASCHANLGGERHFETDTNTCNVCHFIDSLKHLDTQEKKPISDCVLCHAHVDKTTKIYEKTFSHDVYEGNENVSCSDCHFTIVQGKGRVEKERCYRCHEKVGNDAPAASDMHRTHTDTYKTSCTSCHASITHGWIDGKDAPLPSVDAYTEVQKLIMMGMGGAGIKGEPDPMYLATLNCAACHKDTVFSNVKHQVCNNCHVRGFDKILLEQKRFVSFHLQLLKTLLIKAKRYRDVNTDRAIQEAEANYQVIKKDGSFGAHNIKFVKDLLGYSIGQLKQITRQNADMVTFHENL